MKEKERKLAQTLYVNERKTAKEIAALIGVTENTVGTWINKHHWKNLRDAMVNAPDGLIQSLKQVIALLTEQRIELENDPGANPKDKARLADEVAKYTKALDSAKKETQIPLATYVHVMERIFKALYAKHPELYTQLIDFQEEHLNEIAAEL